MTSASREPLDLAAGSRSRHRWLAPRSRCRCRRPRRERRARSLREISERLGTSALPRTFVLGADGSVGAVFVRDFELLLARGGGRRVDGVARACAADPRARRVTKTGSQEGQCSMNRSARELEEDRFAVGLTPAGDLAQVLARGRAHHLLQRRVECGIREEEPVFDAAAPRRRGASPPWSCLDDGVSGLDARWRLPRSAPLPVSSRRVARWPVGARLAVSVASRCCNAERLDPGAEGSLVTCGARFPEWRPCTGHVPRPPTDLPTDPRVSWCTLLAGGLATCCAS